MTQTRRMLSLLIEDRMSRKEGYPILDCERKEVSKEIHKYEKWYMIYKLTTIVLFLLLLLLGIIGS